jgi:SM-20-related protein
MISVRILLDSGHVYETKCAENAPMLDSLAEALSGANGCRFAQLIIENGNARIGVAIPASAIRAVETTPPVRLDRQSKGTLAEGTFAPAAYIRIPGFLSDEENRAILDYAIRKEQGYETSGVDADVPMPDYRRSRVLMRVGDLKVDFDERIREIVPEALDYFRLPPSTGPKLETQLTSHNDGGYYRIHNDNGSPSTATRVLTYVYYFHRQPVAFKGGQLRLYDSRIQFGRLWPTETFFQLNPENNMLLLFPSSVMHEVLPTYCSSLEFTDGRFTLNGWVRDQAS